MRASRLIALVAAFAVLNASARPPVARADICGAAGVVSGLIRLGCRAVTHPKQVIGAARSLARGHPVAAAKALLGAGGGAPSAVARGVGAAAGLAAVIGSAVGGLRFALIETARMISASTRIRLGTVWFSAAYWRVAGIAALLTLPFLFAAAIQAIAAADLALLARAAFQYLPLSLIGVGLAVPLITLLVEATDEMSGLVTATAGADGASVLGSSGLAGGVAFALRGSPFIALLVSCVIASGALLLWIELAIREVAVYVVVLLLPLAFAAMVWPSRRGWALRAIELLVALILAKFVVVAVLALGASALGHLPSTGLTGVLMGGALVMLAAFAPWTVLRLVPTAEVAASVLGSLRAEAQRPMLAAEGLASTGDAHDRNSSSAEVVGDTDPAGTASRIVDGLPASRGPGDAERDPPEGSDAHAPGGGDSGGERTEGSWHPDAPWPEFGRATLASSTGAGRPEVAGGDRAAPSGDRGTSETARREERVPGMDPIWQTADSSWPTMILGPGAGHTWSPVANPSGAGAASEPPPLLAGETELLPPHPSQVEDWQPPGDPAEDPLGALTGTGARVGVGVGVGVDVDVDCEAPHGPAGEEKPS